MSSFAPESKGSGQTASSEYAKFDEEDAVYFGGKNYFKTFVINIILA